MNWIFAYYQAIIDGTEVVGKWTRLIYEYLVKGLEAGLFFYDSKKANAKISWIESHCFHVKGRLAPGPLKLELFQKAYIAAVFGIVDKNGDRQFWETLLVIARKCGKSLLGSNTSQVTQNCMRRMIIAEQRIRKSRRRKKRNT